MQTLRQRLAEAKIALRSAKDTLKTAETVATLGVTGKNPEERKTNAAQALLNDRPYTLALMHVRVCEATLERAETELAEQEHELRVREVAAREKLAEALMGRRVDDAAVDSIDWYEVQNEADHRRIAATEAAHRSECEQRMLASRNQDPVFPAGSNAGEYYPNDWYK